MTAADIIADATRLTKEYAQAIVPVPDLTCVYVLTRNLIVLGVFKSEAQAVDEAADLMRADGGWVPFARHTWTWGTHVIAVHRHKVQ